ncbi:MAG: hypothetical protein IH849_07955 [Acidobacteria bacterium]|nr:hypothetical protein [Acidobacteriota bacterium]
MAEGEFMGTLECAGCVTYQDSISTDTKAPGRGDSALTSVPVEPIHGLGQGRGSISLGMLRSAC